MYHSRISLILLSLFVFSTAVAQMDSTTSASTPRETNPPRLPSWMKPKPKTKKPTPEPAALETTPIMLTMESTKAMEESTIRSTPSMAPLIESTMAPIVEASTARPSITLTPVKPKKTRKPKIHTLPPIDFDCSRKDDGYYANPKDRCSSIYYACVGGLGRRMECATKELVYEPDTGVCERRHESYRCTGTRKTTPATTPRAPPPPTPAKLLIDCSKLDDGMYPDPTKKCSHVFYTCSNGIGSKLDCAGRMYYDANTKSCLAYHDVEACIGRKPETKKPETTTPAKPKEKLPIDCSVKRSGTYGDPTKKCSEIYYVCSNGDGFKRECPKGTFYDVKNGRCDFFDEVYACSYRTKGPSTIPVTTIKPAPSPASLSSTEYNCTGKGDATYLPESKKCSSHYFRCVGGVTYKLHCPDGLFYDLKNDLCDRWINLFECSGKKPTSPKPTEPTKAPVIEKLPIDCTKYPDGDYPDPEKKCSTVYYSCSGQIGKRRECPLRTFFDKDLSICDTKENVPACSNKPRPKTPRPTPRRPVISTKAPYDCEKRKDGNYQYGKCHPKYWACVGGSPTLSTCPHGTVYDVEMNECGYKHEIPACGGTRPTAPTVTHASEE